MWLWQVVGALIFMIFPATGLSALQNYSYDTSQSLHLMGFVLQKNN